VRLHDATTVWLCAGACGASPAGDEDEIAARDADGRALGRVAYRRVYGPRAVLALEVDDALWHRGLPAALLAAACDRAAAHGSSTFLVRVRAGDLRLLALLRERFAAGEVRDGGFVDVELATVARTAARSLPRGTTTADERLWRTRTQPPAARLLA
jgi:GNAT superfamily N-acetyltransferase